MSTLQDQARFAFRRLPVLPSALEAALTARSVRRAVPALQRSDHPAAPAVLAAIDALRDGHLDAAETTWQARIERRRSELGSGLGAVELDQEATPAARRFGKPRMDARFVASLLSIGAEWGRFFMRLVRELAPRSCLELGAAAGISSAYQGAGLELTGGGKLVTIEGQPQMATIARETLSSLGLRRVDLVVGGFSEVLADLVAANRPLDMVFVDADHTEDATRRHVELLVPAMRPGGVVVFDDIHLSGEMSRAWRAAVADPRLELGLDLRRMGVALVA